MAVTPNKTRWQPRYPCPDAPPFIPMRQAEFRDEENGPYVFWADVPEVDVFANDPDSYYQPLTVPVTFPKRHEVIRLPRCVRILTIGEVGEKTADPTHNAYVDIRETYRPFAEGVRNICQSLKAGIYCQWMVGDPILNGLAFPDYTAETLGFYSDPENGASRNNFDTTMLDSGCVLFGESITFSILDVLTAGAYIVAFPDPPDSLTNFIFSESKRIGIDVAGYWNKMRERQDRMKWIFQSNPTIDYYPQDVFGNDWNAQQQYHANLMQELAAHIQPGWSIGPTYSSDLAYVESVIRDFWNL